MNCACFDKDIFMGKDHKGQPSGSNKEKGLGIKPVMPAENLEINDDLREKHAREDKLADDLKKSHPNRNSKKEDSTNAGGYGQ
jgi:hypothetical protein